MSFGGIPGGIIVIIWFSDRKERINMAFFQVNLFSAVLGFPVDVNIFVPTPNSDEVLNNKNSDYFVPGAKFQVLYLLHGAYGDHTDWFRLTSIEKYATIHKLAVVMPAAANSFYQDMETGSAYLTFLTKELPEFVEKMFPISREREDHFVAGLSMGGYGAWKLALTIPEYFSAAASLSGALDLKEIYAQTKEETLSGPFRWNEIFADPEKIEGSDADLLCLIEKVRAQGLPVPRLYQTVGTEDFIYPANRTMKEHMEKLAEKWKLDYTYAEHPGIHDWDFWDTHIQDVLDWLELRDDSIRPRQGGKEA